eukprot:m.33548 g.33548  ORF g.33548 m.33548 type:complete len:229 (+) comp8564_c0_seq4:691-1377(+)
MTLENLAELVKERFNCIRLLISYFEALSSILYAGRCTFTKHAIKTKIDGIDVDFIPISAEYCNDADYYNSLSQKQKCDLGAAMTNGQKSIFIEGIEDIERERGVDIRNIIRIFKIWVCNKWNHFVFEKQAEWKPWKPKSCHIEWVAILVANESHWQSKTQLLLNIFEYFSIKRNLKFPFPDPVQESILTNYIDNDKAASQVAKIFKDAFDYQEEKIFIPLKNFLDIKM